jgi:hypothetical protein
MRFWHHAGTLSFVILGVAACTTQVVQSSPPPATTETPAEETPAEEADAGQPGPTGGAKEMGMCGPGVPCAAGLDCSGPGTGQGFCAKPCTSASQCSSGQRCKQAASQSYCLSQCFDITNSSDCAPRFVCASSVCVRSCTNVPGYCPSGYRCDAGLCLPAPPPPPPCDPNTSGVTGTKTLSQLTTSERGKVCDFMACAWGGYGQSKTCTNNVTVNGPKSQNDCTSNQTFTRCGSVSVSSYEACQKKLNASPCDSLSILQNDPACAAVKSCAL